MLRPLHAFFKVLDSIKAEWYMYQNIQYFIRRKNCALNFTAVRYSLHKCSETILCWNDNSPFTCHLFISRVSEIMKAKNLPPTTSDLILVNFLLYRALQKIVSSQFPRRWSSKARSVATLGPISQAAIKVALDQLLRRWWWCLGYTVDMLNFCWPNHVYNQRWLAILRQLCTIIERFA